MTEQLPFHFSLSCIGEGNGNPLQCSCLENPKDGGAWWASIYGVALSQTWLKRLSTNNTHTHTYSFFRIFFLSFFFNLGHYKSLLNLLQCCFCFMFFGQEACGILAPQPGMDHAPPALDGEVVFISSRSLLNISCIFSILVSRLFICNSILFSRFWIIGSWSFNHWITREVPRFFSIMGYYRTLNIVPWAIQ